MRISGEVPFLPVLISWLWEVDEDKSHALQLHNFSLVWLVPGGIIPCSANRRCLHPGDPPGASLLLSCFRNLTFVVF